MSAGLAKRARMILLAADGVGNDEIAERVGGGRTTVIRWRARDEERGAANYTVAAGHRLQYRLRLFAQGMLAGDAVSGFTYDCPP